jgi:hypothetical protein
MSSSSSRTRPLNDSTYAFCHGEPGSMNAVAVFENRQQSRSAWEVSSVPLSHFCARTSYVAVGMMRLVVMVVGGGVVSLLGT